MARQQGSEQGACSAGEVPSAAGCVGRHSLACMNTCAVVGAGGHIKGKGVEASKER